MYTEEIKNIENIPLAKIAECDIPSCRNCDSKCRSCSGDQNCNSCIDGRCDI